ncbi:extracellular catalytic domain type 1 short-chain-length polyhydroxyalkanoate depolymerase [Acanthopleuribacter pedis]|uniref:PHB depolymerase family esterase n=1 Tax=Acanthopleuribacter pedis TaxID=442870 RepID=A0A8J7U161_9BACT|nr:PHB depolymerase family esterase [Acanthopleuribacter pedis]MBO1317207.1 PHB depolymerase family esterase [Acanthopleuribacter pedis]MBO1318513.1 PHB depolymerase family esterase [Acanthopleuribacter pedis]
MSRALPCLWVALLCLFGSFTLVHAANTVTGSTAGLAWRATLPAGDAATPRPLLVLLHGCTQGAADFAAATGMDALADEHGFIVLYPEQSSSANLFRCWNWFETINQRRSGEAAAIAAMVAELQRRYAVDADRMYVGGFSAGGAMAVIMGVAYPDLFAGVAVSAGLEYEAAVNSNTAFTVMNSGGPDPDQKGTRAYQVMGSRARRMPVIVVHGTGDTTVAPINGDQVVRQWLQTHDWLDNGADDQSVDALADSVENDRVPGGRAFSKALYQDAEGRVLTAYYRVDGMGHAWSGGSGAFTDSSGPDASALLVAFFGLDGDPTDTTPPVTRANPAGGTFQQPVTVDLSVNEAATTYYSLDGSEPDTGAAVWNGPRVFNSTTTLRFFSVDGAGNREAVQTAVYRIDDGPDTTAPTTLANPPGGDYSGSVTVRLEVDEPATIYYSLDGTTPDAGAAVYSEPLVFSADTLLQFRAVDAAGNWEAVRREDYRVTVATELDFVSVAGEQGTVGLYYVDGVFSSSLVAGDPGMFNGERRRIILSFDLSALPEGAVLAEGRLRLCRARLVGAVQRLDVDAIQGGFGGNAALARGDYSAAADLFNAFTVPVPDGDGACVTVTLPAAVTALAAEGDRLQMRLKAVTAVDFQRDELSLGTSGAMAAVLTFRLQ